MDQQELEWKFGQCSENPRAMVNSGQYASECGFKRRGGRVSCSVRISSRMVRGGVYRTFQDRALPDQLTGGPRRLARRGR